MKNLIIFCTASFTLLFGLLLTWNVYRSVEGDNIEVYKRFYTADSAGTHFNFWGILSPIQTETQRVTKTQIKFSVRIPFPYGEGFKPKRPNGTPEMEVAEKLDIIIRDTLGKMKLDLSFDYDGSSERVRNYSRPLMVKLNPAKVKISIHSTASPEAQKYGFENSIIPGKIERENVELAKGRGVSVSSELQKLGYETYSLSFEELQFKDTTEARKATSNQKIFDLMRFAQADVVAEAESLEVTPATIPILLPLWLLLGGLAFVFLRKQKRPGWKMPTINWGDEWRTLLLTILEVLKIYFLSLILGIIGATLFSGAIYFWDWAKWLVLTVGVMWLLYGIYKYRRGLKEFFEFVLYCITESLRAIWKLLKMLQKKLVYLFYVLCALFFIYIFNPIERLWRRWLVCWGYLTPCWKRTFIILTLLMVAGWVAFFIMLF
jgi:hypothetical protein